MARTAFDFTRRIEAIVENAHIGKVVPGKIVVNSNGSKHNRVKIIPDERCVTVLARSESIERPVFIYATDVQDAALQVARALRHAGISIYFRDKPAQRRVKQALSQAA